MEDKISKKTVVISEKTHQQIKIYCAKNNLKMNDWIDNYLWSFVVDGQKMIDDVCKSTK